MNIEDRQGLGRVESAPPRPAPVYPRLHRRPEWRTWALWGVLYAAGGAVAHFAQPILPELTLAAYAVAFVGGLVFILRYVRTDWRSHPWGRHVMAFMICMEVIFALAVSRRALGEWPGVEEVLFLASSTFAGIVWWRERLQAAGDRRARRREHLD